VAPEVPGLSRVLSAQGWPLASAPPVDERDPGRFATLFGRDSLITSLQLLPVRPQVARATLRTLATMQGRRHDPETDEEPGKIVHEYWPRAPERFRRMGWPVRRGELRYYGSVDSTCWFLVVLAAVDDAELVRELESAWGAAGRWLERALERGGGLLRHGPRRAPGGLAQQGWRDATDPAAADGGGILHWHLAVPAPPLADADSQAVAVVALRALARLSGDERYSLRAAALAARVEDRFGADTMARDGLDRAVAGAGSQLGWLLWSDALSPPVRARFAERLSHPDVLTQWGLRTLSSDHPAFRPVAYHRGAVWPFDSWLGWGGLRAAGAKRTADQVRGGVLDALQQLGLWPELYGAGPDGLERLARANRLQAWTVGAAWALENEWDGRLTF
jgi:glycogen debranching enzyme